MGGFAYVCFDDNSLSTARFFFCWFQNVQVHLFASEVFSRHFSTIAKDNHSCHFPYSILNQTFGADHEVD